MKMTLFWCVFLAGCSTAVMTPVAGEDAGPGPGCAVPHRFEINGVFYLLR